MYRPLEFFLGLRYTRAKKRSGFISVTSLISIISISLGVMALIITLSVMNGFEREMRSSILKMVTHIKLYGPHTIDEWNDIRIQLDALPDVTGTAPLNERKALLTGRHNSIEGGSLRGVMPQYENSVSNLDKYMIVGSLEKLTPRGYNIILGYGLANKLNVNVGDRVIVTATVRNNTIAGAAPREKAFKVVGIFDVGFYDYDQYVGFVHMQDLDRLYRLGNKIDVIQVQTMDLLKIDDIKDDIFTNVKGSYSYFDWQTEYKAWFSAVKMEKILISLLLFLIIMVAAINVISSLIMVVSTKKSDIAILRTFGVTRKQITGIFMIQGSFIGVLGNLIGGVLGTAISYWLEDIIAWLEEKFDFKLIDGFAYNISVLPSEVHWDQVFYILSASLIVSIAATIIPARLASKTQPAEALRYE